MNAFERIVNISMTTSVANPKSQHSEQLFSEPANTDSPALPVSPNDSQTVRPLPLKISRDEMNLAEFPLTVLSKRADPSIKTLEFTDTVKGKNGDVINRQWIITGADKFGLPTSSDDEVLLGLLKLTADDGLRSQKVHFTRYELLKILRWTTEGRSYVRLQNALDRLSGVRIKATNAFYDNETKLHSTRNFGILDAYEINDGRDTRPSFFTWSEVLFKSFQVGFIKKLDLEFYLDLQSAVSKRLYRYLDKHFWYRSRMQVNLFVLSHEKIGISRNYVYASSLRQQLEPALEELKDKGVLSEYEFIGKGKSTEVVLVAAHAPRKTLAGSPVNTNNAPPTSSLQTPQESSAVHDGESAVEQMLIQRGIMEKQAKRLVSQRSPETLARIRSIVFYFDDLVRGESHLVSRNPAGFLYRAVEKPFEFVLPNDKHSQPKESAVQGELSLDSRGTAPTSKPQPRKNSKEQHVDAEISYLLERKKVLDELKANTQPSTIEVIQADVEAALAKLKAHISPRRFQEAVEHGVEQRLLDQNGFPDFDAWCKAL